jgi:ferredoxin
MLHRYILSQIAEVLHTEEYKGFLVMRRRAGTGLYPERGGPTHRAHGGTLRAYNVLIKLSEGVFRLIVTNNAAALKRHLMLKVAQALLEGSLLKDVDHIAGGMRPRGGNSTRCCIWRDRAIIRYRLIAILGGRIEDEKDEIKPLSEYAKEALERSSLEKPILTVLDESCTACVEANYFVTNACKGCLARPCTMHCPSNAILIEGESARILPDACTNCGQCQQVCPYHAIMCRCRARRHAR